jgi:hypothetical protein
LQKDHSTRLNTTFKRHLQQMKAVMKSIWTGEPNEKQREQRDFVLRHVLYQNRPCLLADYVQGHSGAAMRNKSEDVKKLLLKGIQAVVALTTPASGRPTNEHLAVKRILLGSACLHLKKGQFTEAARLLDTSRRAISVSTALAIDELEGPRLQGGSPLLQLKAGFLKTRGLERSQGLFCKTPAAIIEAITHYYTIASIACPGKHDVCTNPDDRSEREGKRLLFGNIHTHHYKCLKLVQEEQLDKWNETRLVDGDQCFDTALTTSTHLLRRPRPRARARHRLSARGPLMH